MQEIKYSFVLPAYKARFFREAIDSILAQTYKDFELIIVNDASPEDLDSIVNSYDDSRIRYYVNERILVEKTWLPNGIIVWSMLKVNISS